MKFSLTSSISVLLFCITSIPTFAQDIRLSKATYDKSESIENVASKYDILELEIADLKNLNQKKGQLNLAIQIDKSHTWDLELSPSNIFTSGITIRLLGEGSELTAHNQDIETYKGQIKGIPNSSVAMTKATDYVSVMIIEENTTYILEPVKNYKATAPSNQFIFYNATDMHPSNTYACKKSEVLSELSDAQSLNKSSGLACYDVELAIAVDYQMYVAEGSTASGVLNTLATIYNLVSLDFDNEFNHQLNIRIKEVVIAICPACDQWSTTNNVGHALDAIRNWGENGGFNETYDIGIYWTTRVYDDNFAGLAYQDQICNEQRYIAVRKYTANNLALKIMMSHEIGHSFGCGHNYEIGSACASNPGRLPKIMDPIVNPSSIGWTNGTQSCDLNSIAVVNAKITSADCLTACQNISCNSITSLSVNNINQSGMNVSWSGSASNYQVRVKEEGASNYIYSLSSSSSSLSISTSLEYCKQYHVSVKALCGSGADPAAITEIVEIPGGTEMQVLYVEPKNCDSGAYDLEVVVAYQNTVPGGFRIVANGSVQIFSYTSSPQTVNIIGLNSANNTNALLEAYGVSNSGPACHGQTRYTEPNANCDIVISEFFDECELPYLWNATSSNSSVFSENFEWKFNDGNRTILNYGAAENANTTKTINGTCAAYFDDDIFMNSTYTGNITLESRAYDLTNMSHVTIEVDYNFHNFEQGKMTNNTSEFSIDVFNGTNWVNVMFDNDDSCVWFNVWASGCINNFILDVTNYLSSQFKVRFNYTDGNSGDWTGMIMLDDFKVSGSQLPVLDLQIIDFKGYLDEHIINLDWDIELDKSFSHYRIEKSSDGESYNDLVELQNGIQYVDNQPVVGSNYYKLYMFDLNGKFVESNTIMIEYNPSKALKLFPNPTNSDQVTLLNTSGVNYNKVKIFDIEGRMISTLSIEDEPLHQFDISNVNKGIYLIQLSNERSSKTLRLVKL